MKLIKKLRVEFDSIKNENLFSAMFFAMKTNDINLCEKYKMNDFRGPITIFNNFIKKLNKIVQSYADKTNNDDVKSYLHILNTFDKHVDGLLRSYFKSLLRNKQEKIFMLAILIHDMNHIMMFIEDFLNKKFPTKIELYKDGYLSQYEVVTKNNKQQESTTKLINLPSCL